MAESETLNIVVKLKDLAGRHLKDLGGTFDTLKTKAMAIQNSIFGIKTAIVGLVATAGLGALGREFIQTAAAFEGWATRLTRVLGSVEEGNRLFKEMQVLAKKSTAEYGSIMDAATNMAGVMEGGTEEVKQYMKITDDLAAITGMTIQETTSQVIRMYSAGAASADMFRERGVLAMLGFQGGVSYTAEETRKKLIAAWEDPASKFRRASEDLANTYEGLMSMIADEWQDFQVGVMSSGVFDYLKGVLGVFLDIVREMKSKEGMEEFQKNISNFVIRRIETAARIGAVLTDIFRGWNMVWQGLKMTFAVAMKIFITSWQIVLGEISKTLDLLMRLGALIEKIPGVGKLGEGFNKVAEGIQGVIAKIDKEAEIVQGWTSKILEDSENQLGVIAAQGSAWKRVNGLLEKVRDRAAEYKRISEEGPSNLSKARSQLKPEASMKAQLAAQAAVQNAQISLAMTSLQRLYEEGKVTLTDYFNQRRDMINKQFELEIAAAQQAAITAPDLDRKAKAQAKVDELRIKQKEALLKLQYQEEDAIKAANMAALDNAAMLADLRNRVMEEGMDKERDLYNVRLAELKTQQEQEIEQLRQQRATMEQINEAYRLHEKEQEKLLADHQYQVRQKQLQNAQTVASGLSDLFGDMYETSGESVKEFFYLQKAAAVAEAIINAHTLATKAMKEGGTYMGPVLAAIHYAKAMMHVAQIRSQKLAGGGEVEGYSPSPTADNIPIRATAGEYMQPVKTVRYYGKEVMEAMRRRMIPREVFSGVKMPIVRHHYGHGFAAGGPVENTGGGSTDQPITIVNTPDPNLLERYLAGESGRRTLLNVIRSESYEVKAALSDE